MRRSVYRGPESTGIDLLARAPHVHVATTAEDGRPILKTVHGVLLEDDGVRSIAFHGAPAGEKMEGLGRAAVVAAEEVVASIPSWFLDATLACPATTYYVGVQAHGTLRAVEDVDRKGRALAALMAKHQPEGRHAAIDARGPLYAKAIAGLLVAEVAIDRLDCKEKLGQNRKPEDRSRVVEALWRRGSEGDVRAVARLLRRFPELPRPSFAAGVPAGYGVVCHLDDGDLRDAAELLRQAYWLEGTSGEDRARALAASPARVGIVDPDGRLVAVARATTDTRVAWIYDVLVDEAHRGRGLGDALVGVLLDHPAVRTARHVRLTTRDMDGFYRRFGFATLDERPRHPWRSIEMVRSAP